MSQGHHHVSMDYYAYISGIKEWNSYFKVGFAVGAVLLVVICNLISVSIFTLFFMLFLTVKIGRMHVHDYIRLMTIPLFFIVFSGLAIMIHFDSQPQPDSMVCLPFFITNLFITKADFMLAVETGIKALGAVSALYMLSSSTPIGEILSAFRRIHVPDIILELMHLIYRYIFILSEVNQKQKDAARSRLGYIDYKTSLRTFGSELANLFLMSMKKAEHYYDAMEARGYEGNGFFWEEKKPLTMDQIIWAVVYFGIVIILVVIHIW